MPLTVVGEPPLVVYVMLQGPVPVKAPVSCGEPLTQKGPLPLSVAVGLGFTTALTDAGKLVAEQFASLMAVIA